MLSLFFSQRGSPKEKLEDLKSEVRLYDHLKEISPEDEFLDKIQTKFFLLAIHSHLYSFALRFLFIQTHATSYSFYGSVTEHCKGERRKT
jgi:hypothetical protein